MVGKLHTFFRADFVNRVPNDFEYRQIFHIGRNSFFVLLNYLEVENFFGEEYYTGRPRRIREEVILLGIISYFTQSQSIVQCAFKSGIMNI